MGEGTASLDRITSDPSSDGIAASPRDATRELEGRIGLVREELGGLVAELDRRRHEALDLKLQIRRHALETTVTGLAFVAAAAGIVWLTARRARRRRRITSRMDRMRTAMGRMMERPERVAAEPTIPAKIFTAAVNAALATVIKKGLERVVQRMAERGEPGATRDLARSPRPVRRLRSAS